MANFWHLAPSWLGLLRLLFSDTNLLSDGPQTNDNKHWVTGERVISIFFNTAGRQWVISDQWLMPHGPASFPLRDPASVPSPALCACWRLDGLALIRLRGTSSDSVQPPVQRLLSPHLLWASLFSEGVFYFFGCFIDIDCTFFFKFLRITELPLYTGCTIIPAPYNARSPLNLLVLTRAGPGSRLMMAADLQRSTGSGKPPGRSHRGNGDFPGASAAIQPGSRPRTKVIVAKNSFLRGLAQGQLCYIIMTGSTFFCLFFYVLFTLTRWPRFPVASGFFLSELWGKKCIVS